MADPKATGDDGWTVTVVGPASIEATGASAGTRSVVVRVRLGLVSGRRLPVMALPAA